MKRKLNSLVIAVVASVGLAAVPVARAGFGFVPGSASVTALNSNGTIDARAASHPYEFVAHFELNTDQEGEPIGGEIRSARALLPRGLYGNPEAVAPACSREQFGEGGGPKCPPDTQVGVLHATVVKGIGEVRGAVYNVKPPRGIAAELGFASGESGLIVLEYATVRADKEYRLQIATPSIPVGVTSVTETVWGTPADPSHDFERGPENAEGLPGRPPIKSTAPHEAYLTLPVECRHSPSTVFQADSVLEPGIFAETEAPNIDVAGNPVPMSDCESVPFEPQVAAAPSTRLASNPTGLGFELSLPNKGLTDPEAIAETQPEKVEVLLPEGVTLNPSAGEGLDGCPQAAYEAEQLDTPPGQGCPEASKLGSILIHSPVLSEPIEGSLYLAETYKNPFGTLFALYVVARGPGRGILVKQAGKVIPDPNTGRLLTIFEGLPPLPYADFHLHFREGGRAPLVSPPTCGEYQTTATLYPASEPDSPYTVSAPFGIEHGTDGGACPPGGVPAFSPRAIAGTNDNVAGSYSPFYLRIERGDGEQEITGFATQLPPGLSGNLNGVPFCSETAIQQAREQTGAEAETSPACPAASQIGHTVAEAGVGSVLARTPGRLYLGGPFEGAPFSVVSITSAKVGPFDLGTVVVHLPLRIDPLTAQVSIPSGPADQIPHIVKGVVIHLRAIRVYVDRERFMLNPTSCEAMQVGASVIGSGANFASPLDDQAANLAQHFQTADCSSLAFKPDFKVSVTGKSSRKNGVGLKVKLSYPQGSLGKAANIKSAKVDLPRQLPSRLSTLQKACTEKQFNANPAACPPASRVGTAVVHTPILPVALEGPAYFVSYGGAKFPELIIVLQGYGLTIDLHGETFISKKGITSSTFRSTPDQPFDSFELTLPQGPFSALAANGNLCTVKGGLKMPTALIGQNAATVRQNTRISVTGCPKKAKPHGSVRSTV